MFYVILYLAAIILANLIVAAIGPQAVFAVAFLFIGLDLTARDKLHDAWRGRNLLLKMAALIAAGSVLSWLVNLLFLDLPPEQVEAVATASFIAFAATATTDAVIYHLLGGYPRWLRINGSNIPSAAVDSVVFPTLAFGGFLPLITLGQFAAKVAGGFLWSLVFRWLDQQKEVEATA